MTSEIPSQIFLTKNTYLATPGVIKVQSSFLGVDFLQVNGPLDDVIVVRVVVLAGQLEEDQRQLPPL